MRNTKEIDERLSLGVQSDTGVKPRRTRNTAVKAEVAANTAVQPPPEREKGKGPATQPWSKGGLRCRKCGNRIRKRPFVMTADGPTHRICPTQKE